MYVFQCEGILLYQTWLTSSKLQLKSVLLSEISKLTSVSSGPSIAILISWGKETSESQFCSLFNKMALFSGKCFHCITLEELYFHVFRELERSKLLSQADPFVKLL